MQYDISAHTDNVLHHLYINPLEKCNLKCKICYTKKTAPILKEEEILDFIERYNKTLEVKVITFCGGEVFALAYFPHLVNTLTKKGIFIQIITNGTIDKLDEFDDPNKVNLIVSLDGLEEYHDANRGKGSFNKSISFLKKAKMLGFHTEIFSIVTKQNLKCIDTFEAFLKKELGPIEVTYHPRKPMTYLNIHPVSKIVGEIEGFDFLEKKEIQKLMMTKKTFPPKEFGCYQISLVSDGTIYGCCEGFKALGSIGDNIPDLISKLKSKIGGQCLGCVQPGFLCGLKDTIKGLTQAITKKSYSPHTETMKNLQPTFIREEIIKAIRAFFYAKKFHEVIVPVLNDAVPLESHLFPFETSWNTIDGEKKRYLSLSPERSLKRMLAVGIGNCFALGKSFRNLENVGRQHLPEFLMLEWYREGADYHHIMKDTEELVLFIQKKLKSISHCEEPGNLRGCQRGRSNLKTRMTSPWKKVSLEILLKNYLRADYERMMNDGSEGWREQFDQLFVNEIESRFPKEPFFLIDFPARVSPLCKPQKEKPHLAERFELYISGMEIGNGNTENTDADSVRKTLKKPVDEVFLKVLNDMKGKSYAGMGIGVDRLAMLFSGVTDIKEVEILV